MESGLMLTNSCVPYFHKNEPENPVDNKADLIPDNKTLLELRISRPEFLSILQYVEKKVRPLSDPVIIKKNVSKLPFTIACMPNGNEIATCILFKKHRIEQIGDGGFNSITLGWDVVNKTEVAFRSSALCNIDKYERDVNKILSARKDLFVVSDYCFTYFGPFSPKSYWERTLPPLQHQIKSKVPMLKGGFILERLKCSLGILLGNNPLNFKTKLFIAYRILIALDVLHNEYKLIHSDLKAENILIAKSNLPKIADFGAIAYKDETFDYFEIEDIRCYHPPESIDAFQLGPEEEYKADFSFDMWSYGALLIRIFCEPDTFKKWETLAIDVAMSNEPMKFKDEMKDFMDSCFKSSTDPNLLTILNLVNKCLEYNPDQRITARKALKEEVFNEVSSMSSIQNSSESPKEPVKPEDDEFILCILI